MYYEKSNKELKGISSMQKDLSSNISQATKWSSITEVAAKLVSPIVNMVLARLLVPETFGIVATITMVISFAEVFTDAGFQKYIIQHEFKDEEELDRSTDVAFWTNLIISVVACFVIFFFRHQIAELVGSPGLGNSISIASVLIIIAAFSSIQMARYKRSFDFRTLFFARIGTSLIPLIVTLPLAVVLRNYWALLIGQFSSQLFNAVALTIKSRWRPRLRYSFRLLKEMFSFSLWTLLESISIWLTSYIGTFIVGSHLNDYYLGLYKTSMSTVNAYMAIVTAAITPVLFSALSRYQKDEEKFRDTYYSFQRMTAVLIIPMGMGIFVFRDFVTRILLGANWMEASGFIGLWGVTSAFAIVYSHFASEVYRSKGNPKISLFVQIIHLLFIIPVLLTAVRYNFDVLYTARSLVRLQIIPVAVIIMHVKYNFKVMSVIKNTMPMLMAATVMSFVGVALKQVSGTLIWQIIAVVVCIVVYFSILLGCFPRIRLELAQTSYFGKIAKYIQRHK